MSKIGFEIDETTKDQHNPLNNLLPRDRERAEFWENEKNTEEIMKAGQDDRKEGIKAVQSQEEEKAVIEKKAKDDILNKLDMKKRFAISYKSQLAQALADLLEMLDWLPGWKAQVVVTDGSPISIMGKGFKTEDGLLIIVIAADGRIFHQGVFLTHDPALDYMALNNLALMAENRLDKEKGLLFSEKKEEPSIVDQYGQPIGQ